VINIQVDAVSLDTTVVKIHPDGTGALKKRSTIYWQIPVWIDKKIRMIAVDHKTAVIFSLSPGNAGDAPEGRKLLESMKDCDREGPKVIMDKACEGTETRQLELGTDPIVPPKSNRSSPC
jgi:hypothetical protein